MSVTVPMPGTRGSRFPKFPGWLARFFSRIQRRMFRGRRGGRTQGGVPALMLETIGAKSGDVRHAMLGFVEDGPGAWLVVASLAGAARNPAWLYNLARNARATIEFGDGRRVPVEATTLSGPELEAAWRKLAIEAPEYTKYRSQTDRPIPVVRLRGLAGEGEDPRSRE
jgi:deazaflavin-dependent oxidoreductase (nitroreductase family)